MIEKLKILKENFERLQKLNEDLIENYLAKKSKIERLERKIEKLEKGIQQSANEIKEFMKDLDANT